MAQVGGRTRALALDQRTRDGETGQLRLGAETGRRVSCVWLRWAAEHRLKQDHDKIRIRRTIFLLSCEGRSAPADAEP